MVAENSMWGGELAKIRVDDLNKSVMEILEAYKGATEEDVKRAVDKVGKECVDELKNAHPPGSKNWDRYNSGWTIMQTKKDKKEHISATVHNSKHYQLTHLLEKGHALVNGGRTRPFPHIAPVADKADDELFQAIKDRV